MPMLDAVLAFALTMLAVASLVSAIVSKIGASANYRKETFGKQLAAFYEVHVKQVVDEKLKLAEGEADKGANRAVADLMAQMNVGATVELSTRDLLTRLAGTGLGSQLTAKVGDELGELEKKLGAGWEQIGQEFSAQFRQRARLFSYLIGIVAAIALNIDSIYIMETYLTDDEALAEALGQQDAMLTQYAAFLDVQATGDTAVARAREDIASIKADIDALTGAGLPLGWDHWPWNGCGGTDDAPLPRCGAVEGDSAPSTGDAWALWLLGVLLTGCLAGLGAPFWYDLVTGLNHIAQTRRGSHQRNTAGEEVAA